MHKIHSSTWYLVFMLLLFFILLMPEGGLQYDLDCWINWCGFMFENGLPKVYNYGINYLPGHLYQMVLYTKLFHNKQDVIDHIYYLKYFNILFDFLGALLVCSLVKDKNWQKMVFLCIILNPAYIHNTVLWGQFDSVFTSLVLASLIAIQKRKFIFGVLLFITALNFKFQAIVFLPVLGLSIVLITGFKMNWKAIITGTLSVIILQVLFLLPFITGHTMDVFYKNLKGLSGQFDNLTLNAGNFWYLVQSGDLRWTGDWNKYLGSTYKSWGFNLFWVSLAVGLFPFMWAVFQKLRKKEIPFSFEKILLAFTLSPLVFYFFNTQMHERYSFPAILFAGAYACLTQRWWLYALISIAYFINNEKALQSFKQFNYNSPYFDFQFAAWLFLAAMIALFFYTYKKEDAILKS